MYWKESDSMGSKEYERVYDGDGSIRYHPFFSEQSRLPINMQVWELDPGVSEGSHTHDDLEEVYYFVAGSGVMWADGTEVPVAAGDAVLAPPGCDHGFRNTGDVPLKLVLIWGNPVLDHDLTV